MGLRSWLKPTAIALASCALVSAAYTSAVRTYLTEESNPDGQVAQVSLLTPWDITVFRRALLMEREGSQYRSDTVMKFHDPLGILGCRAYSDRGWDDNKQSLDIDPVYDGLVDEVIIIPPFFAWTGVDTILGWEPLHPPQHISCGIFVKNPQFCADANSIFTRAKNNLEHELR